MFEGTMVLPFKQDAATVRMFEFWNWRFYVNKARPCEERHSSLLHDKDEQPHAGGNFWVSHKATVPRFPRVKGWFTTVKNTGGEESLIHRITAGVRQSDGISYLQVIFFSWWVGIVRKGDGAFLLLSKGE